MKITCYRQELVNAVSNVQRSVSSKSTIPALEGILIKTDDQKISLCGYNLELGITTAIPADVSEPGEIILNAKIFSDIVRKLPDENVNISVNDRLITEITSGLSKFSIVGIAAEEFPVMPKITGSSQFSLSSALLKSMIKQTLFAVSENDTKPIHTGTLFTIEEQKIHLVSVDGYRLAMRSENIDCAENFRFVVPGKTLSEVIKLLSDQDEETKIMVGKRHIIFSIENYSVISRLLEGEFLDYKAAIPASGNTRVKVNTREFIDSTERVSLLITDRLKSPLRCIFADDTIELSCSTSIGSADDKIASTIEGEDVEIGFNNRYLLDALRNTDSDEVFIELNGSLSPMKILPREGDAFLFLILPVRLKSE